MPPQNPYPYHQEGLWLESREKIYGGDIKVKNGEIWYVLDKAPDSLHAVLAKPRKNGK